MDVGLAVASKRDWRSYSDQPVPEGVQRRILDAGRLAGSAVNKQPWRFVIVESEDAKQRVSQVVYAEGNIQTCAFAVAIVTEGGGSAIDVGRAMQNMFLVAWNEGVVSCPNGIGDQQAAGLELGLDEGWLPVNIPSFGYPKRDLAPESKSVEEWSAEANRKPLDELIRRI